MQQALKAKNTDSKASVKIFQREQRSLFGEILDWMLTPLLLLWPVSLALTWLVAQSLANKPFDRALEYNVHALAQLILVDAGGQLHFNLPQPASEMLRADESDMVLFQVTTSDGSFLAGDSDIPLTSAPQSMELGQVELRDDAIRGMDMRVAALRVRLPVLTDDAWALVQVAETRESAACWPRNHQGRDAAAVRHPATVGTAGVAGTGARHTAAAPAGDAHPRTQAR